MSRLHRFFRLSSLRDEIETRLLAQEYRALIIDDLVDDGTSHELQSKYAELSHEIGSHRRRHYR
ncbi:hypothetical protein FP026_29215 [Rhizobium tropici]|uniref:Uncharacterized protein n=1 Tax=Rhizobium tropici TaxID=398 RepID=A0A5B0VNB6_RHITR|nr:hypothetical protein [Rhizobium tropici]KAA1175339.1 hypothetical protein FP026_29215 [Rhizobium tropici]